MNNENYANPVPGREPSLYEQHQSAAQNFVTACRDFQDAKARRNGAEKQLQDITQRLGQVIVASLNDPAAPQPPQQENSGLGTGDTGMGSLQGVGMGKRLS